MGFSKELETKLDYYEQVYFGLDEPIPFKSGLKLYPVLVKDYYRFYNCFGCISADKNIKMITGPDGRPKRVSNPKGIGQSYLDYLIDQMEDPEKGAIVTNQVMDLLELVFHVEKGQYCTKCGKQISYSEIYEKLNKHIADTLVEAKEVYNDALKQEKEKSQSEENNKDEDKPQELPNDIKELFIRKARGEFFQQLQICSECGGEMRDVFSIKNNNGLHSLMIKDVELGPGDFDEFKAIVPRQNVLDYDGDKYMDYDLKDELELKARLQNQDYTAPTLEKQIVCVAVGTGYSLEYLKTIPMRKLSMLLRIIDRKESYYTQLQASMSGFVTFKEDPKHWIFSDDKKNIAKELTSIDNFTKKFDAVT